MENKMRLFFLLIVIVCFNRSPAFAQSDLIFGLNTFSGKFLVSYENQPNRIKRQQGFSLDISRQTKGKKYWQFAHNYPKMGLTLDIRDLGNNAVYGKAISLVPFLSFPVLRSESNLIFVKHGVGLAYLTKTNDEDKNFRNEFIGSHINAAAFVMVGYERKISETLNGNAGIQVNHYSNGSVKVPNRGINSFNYQVGLNYIPNRDFEKIKYDKVRPEKKWWWRAGTAIGFYRDDVVKQDLKYSFQGHVMSFYQHNTRFRSGLGLEYLRLQNGLKPLSIYGENEVLFSHIATRYGFGLYLGDRPSPQNFYSKIGAAYYFKKSGETARGLSIGSYLKAHGFKAAHIELAANYLF